MKFVAYSTMAIPQARIAFAIPYGSVNNALERVHPARPTGGAAERARHQEAARQLQLRLVDRQPRCRGRPLQQMAAELSAMNGRRARRLGAARRPRETLRSHQRGRRRLARHPLGRVPDAAGAQRLGQDHDPDDDRGLRDADRGRHRHRRRRRWSPCRPTGATSAWCSRTMRCSPISTVADNIGFPLKQRGVPKAERAEAGRRGARAGAAAGLRRPLSAPALGRPAARGALARAIVFKPRLLLMDEPLGALGQAAAREPAARDAAPARRSRHHLPLRDARPGRRR